jgi:hypothetical protein
LKVCGSDEKVRPSSQLDLRSIISWFTMKRPWVLSRSAIHQTVFNQCVAIAATPNDAVVWHSGMIG